MDVSTHRKSRFSKQNNKNKHAHYVWKQKFKNNKKNPTFNSTYIEVSLSSCFNTCIGESVTLQPSSPWFRWQLFSKNQGLQICFQRISCCWVLRTVCILPENTFSECRTGCSGRYQYVYTMDLNVSSYCEVCNIQTTKLCLEIKKIL